MAKDLQEPADTLVVDDIGVLKVLAGTLRLRIIELLRQRAATVKELAAALEIDPKSLYYHVNLLERHGLLRVVGTRLVSGILEKHYRATAYVFYFPDLAGQSRDENPRLLQDYATNLLEITAEEIRVGIARGRIEREGDGNAGERSLHMAWRLLQLRPEEATALTTRMDALLAEFEALALQQPSGDRGTYRLLQMVFPTYRRTPTADAKPEGER